MVLARQNTMSKHHSLANRIAHANSATRYKLHNLVVPGNLIISIVHNWHLPCRYLLAPRKSEYRQGSSVELRILELLISLGAELWRSLALSGALWRSLASLL